MARFIQLAFCLAAASLPLLGQLESDTITVTASRRVQAVFDQAIVGVYVDADFNKDLDDVVAVVAGVGVAKSNLIQVSTVNLSTTGGPQLEWVFRLQVPFSKLQVVLGSLESIRQANKPGSGFTLYSYVEGGETATDTICKYEDLVSDARLQAQKVAISAGLRTGLVLRLSDVASGGVLVQQAQQPQFNRVGYFVDIVGLLPATQPDCSLSVTFHLLRN